MNGRRTILGLALVPLAANCGGGGGGGNPPDPGLLVGSASASTTEAGGQAMFTVALNAKPGADVEVTLASSDTTEGVVSPSMLTFTPVNFAAPQTVTVSGVDDEQADGGIEYVITVSAAGSVEQAYAGLAPIDVAVVNIDDESAGITVAPISGATTEWGGQATFTVVLHSAPTADVVVSAASDTPSEGTANPQSLTFTEVNWNAPQTVTITGVDDDVADGSSSYAVLLGVESTDSAYGALSPAGVPVVNVDDETASFLVGPASGTTTELGGTATFTVRLGSRPGAEVTLEFDSTDPGEGAPDLTTLVFDSTNWDEERTVTVAGVDDSSDDGNQPYAIAFDPPDSADPSYAALSLANLVLTNVDDETAGITFGSVSGPTSEGGGVATFTVQLDSQPAADVTLTFDTSDPGEGTPDLTTLVFTTGNWSAVQTVTVTGADDTIDDGNQPYVLAFDPPSSADAGYAALTVPDLAFTNLDDEVSVTMSTHDAFARGSWANDGSGAPPGFAFVGQIGGGTANAYFAFDLAGLSGTVISAELQLELAGYVDSEASQDLSIWDVDTDIATLTGPGPVQTQVFTDLQSGIRYGEFSVQAADVDTVLSIPLDAPAVSDLTAAAGGDFAVGLHLDSVGMATEDFVTFGSGTEPRTHRLVLVVATP